MSTIIKFPFGTIDSQTASELTQTFDIVDNYTIIDASLTITGASATTVYTFTPDSELATGALLNIKYSAAATSIGNTLTLSGTNGTITNPLITGTTYNSFYIFNGTDFDQIASETSW